MTAYMGIDIGGSGIKGTLVDVDNGELLAERFRLPTPVKAKPEDVAETVSAVIKNFNYHGPVGYGFPAVIRGGIVYTAANISSSWIETHVEDLFTVATGCPSYVLNDADAAGMAEMKFGTGKSQPKGVILMITLGTGLGTAIFVDGKLVPNTELGHIEIRGKDAEKRASDAVRQKKELSWDDWSDRLNEYLRAMERLFWPDLIVLGGGVSKMSHKFIPLLRLRTKVVPAMLLNQAGMIGAALYAQERSQNP
jgi:polyphosphate glucokinase